MTLAQATFSKSSLVESVRQRLEVAQQVCSVQGDGLRRQLPFITLDIHSFVPCYHTLCARALVDQPHAATSHQPTQILVADRQSHPDLAMPAWQDAMFGLGALIEQLEADGFDGCYDVDYKAWQLLSPATRMGLKLLEAPGAWPPWEGAFPLRHFLHWSYAAQGMRLLHAASLGSGGTGVLLAGAGGAGKSGTTLAGISHGLQSVGDDYLAVGLDEKCARAFPVMKLMKQDAGGLARVGLEPQSPFFGERNWQDKFEFDFDDLVPDSRVPELAIGAILLPRITGEARSRLSPASPREVMFALMPNNLQQLPGRMKQGFAFFSRLSRDLPGYHLDLGTDPKEIAATIADFIQRDMR